MEKKLLPGQKVLYPGRNSYKRNPGSRFEKFASNCNLALVKNLATNLALTVLATCLVLRGYVGQVNLGIKQL